mmetsp:Transcript_23706/g.42120  ORF Transcript_23706/g.42120 Transcript_23706/m.42120 type:complete len:148 (+) Transcript_23706:73-516(+)
MCTWRRPPHADGGTHRPANSAEARGLLTVSAPPATRPSPATAMNFASAGGGRPHSCTRSEGSSDRDPADPSARRTGSEKTRAKCSAAFAPLTYSITTKTKKQMPVPPESCTEDNMWIGIKKITRRRCIVRVRRSAGWMPEDPARLRW